MLRQAQHERVSACAKLRTVRPELVEGQSCKRANGVSPSGDTADESGIP